jgi:putative peptidoglycan lipid II flippase
MVLSAPITRLLFERGAFTGYSTRITAAALFYYAAGLLACGGIKVLVSAFYSLQDTMTPVKVASVSLIVNIILNLSLMGPLKVGGLALANSAASMFNCVLLYVSLRKKIGQLGIGGIIGSLVKILAAGAVMALVCCFTMAKAGVLAAIAAGAAAYLLACLALRSGELKEILLWISGKR